MPGSSEGAASASCCNLRDPARSAPRGFDLYTDFPFLPLSTQRDFVIEAERRGYAGVFATENRHDPFLPLAASARPAQAIAIGTAVIAALARTPFTVAQTAWDLHVNTGESFILGVGTQLDGHLSARYGVSAEAKHERLSEFIGAVREIWRSWREEREPDYRGRHYTIRTCPPGYRPTTRITKDPEILVLCSLPEDVPLACDLADGAFLHPTWIGDYASRFSWPERSPNDPSRRFKIIDGSVIATGETESDLQESLKWAQRRIHGYWMQTKYDPVYSALSIMEEVAAYRRRVGPEGNEPACYGPAFDRFVCAAQFGDLAASLALRHAPAVTGLFPNIMSAMPRLLPKQIVNEVRSVHRHSLSTAHKR